MTLRPWAKPAPVTITDWPPRPEPMAGHAAATWSAAPEGAGVAHTIGVLVAVGGGVRVAVGVAVNVGMLVTVGLGVALGVLVGVGVTLVA